jgi:phosphohistidine phosphatase
MGDIVLLYLLRHGQASSCGHSPGPTLTAQGRREVLRSARRIAQEPVPPGLLWQSPQKRAQETAKLVAEVLRIPPTLRVDMKCLGPEENADGILEALSNVEIPALLMVSHLPTLQDLVCRLLETDASPLLFPTAGWAALKKTDGGSWKILVSVPESLP